jgi:hypothetical protein
MRRSREKELLKLARRIAGEYIELSADDLADAAVHRPGEESELVAGELRRLGKELQLAGECE